MVLHDQYTQSAFAAYEGSLQDIGTDGNVGIMLLDSNYVPDLDADTVVNDISADEVTDTDYSRQTLSTTSWTTGANAVTFDADDVTWANSTITASYAVLFHDTGDDATSTLLQLIDFEGSESSDNGDFTISWDAAGIFEHTPRPA